jgi:hypothetical protein
MRTAEDLSRAGGRLRRSWFGLAPAVPAHDDRFQLKFDLALEHARRSERAFALTRFAPGDGVPVRAWADAFVVAAMPVIRVCDAVGLVAGDAVVVWDDADRASATLAAKRLADAVDVPSDVASTVVFPDDGLTPAALFRTLWDDRGDG